MAGLEWKPWIIAENDGVIYEQPFMTSLRPFCHHFHLTSENSSFYFVTPLSLFLTCGVSCINTDTTLVLPSSLWRLCQFCPRHSDSWYFVATMYNISLFEMKTSQNPCLLFRVSFVRLVYMFGISFWTSWLVWGFVCGTSWLDWDFFLGPVDLFGVSFVGLVDLEQTRAGWDHDQQMASFLSSTNNFSLKQSERKGWFSCSTRRRSSIHTKTFFPPHVLNRVRWWVIGYLERASLSSFYVDDHSLTCAFQFSNWAHNLVYVRLLFYKKNSLT